APGGGMHDRARTDRSSYPEHAVARKQSKLAEVKNFEARPFSRLSMTLLVSIVSTDSPRRSFVMANWWRPWSSSGCSSTWAAGFSLQAIAFCVPTPALRCPMSITLRSIRIARQFCEQAADILRQQPDSDLLRIRLEKSRGAC